LAIPLEINFAIPDVVDWFAKCAPPLSAANVSWIWRYLAAATSIQSDLRDTVAGLLLQSQLAMAEPHFAAAVGEVKTGG
jgi:hypothetical protein